jgi:Protein of unknown function (DUF3365)
MRRIRLTASIVFATAATVGVMAFGQGSKDQPKVDPEALAQARATVKMLDDVYKTAIVVFTDKFVTEEGDVPAGAFAVPWMEEISKHGTHKVRLIDVAGEPIDEKNTAKSDFEKAAVEKIKAGESYVEATATVDGKQVLQAATSVPVVMEKCVMCHPNYEKVPKGQSIGAITYEFPLKK